MFLALDPSSRVSRARGSPAAMMGGAGPDASSDLPDLLPGWGIVYHSQEVVADPANALSVQISPGNVAAVPIFLNLTSAAFNPTSPPTSNLESIWLIEPGSFSLKEGTGLMLTPLVQSSASSGVLPVAIVGMAQPEDLGRQVTASGRKTLAGLIQGRFTSAFPAGPPAEEPPTAPAPGAKPAAEKTPAGPAPLKMSATKSTLLLVADTDWLFDDYSARRYRFLGVTAAEPLNDNLDFAANALDFLSGSSDLVSIRGKGTSLHPFQVVHDMEVRAREKYQEQLSALEARLGEVQRQLTELEGRKSEGGRLIATPEMAKAIDDYRQQKVKLRTERREIRKSLREGIEALENRLLVLNLATPAVLVAAFGLWFYRRRRRS